MPSQSLLFHEGDTKLTLGSNAHNKSKNSVVDLEKRKQI